MNPMGEKIAYVIINFPAKGAVFVLIAAMDRQVASLLLGEMRILGLHSLECIL